MAFITHQNKIEYETDGKVLAEITFPAINETTVDINHTFVDDALRGQGIAGQLMELAVQQLIDTNRKAVASCSYAQKWLEKNPEKAEKLR